MCHPPNIRELPTQCCVRSQVLARYHLSLWHVGLACCSNFNVVMSESKDSAALGSQGASTAAPGGLAVKSDSDPNTQSANTTIDAASNQGYLSKLLGSGFGFGSGTAANAIGCTPATVDEAHEYHPELAFSPTDVGIWEPHSGPPHPPSAVSTSATQHGTKK